MKKLLFLFTFLLSSQLFGQLIVSGKITDIVTKQPIIGAYIIDISDPSNGGVSDLDGNYSLTLPEG